MASVQSVDFSGLKIGYLPYAPGCKAAGDRRRFCAYAALRELPYDEAVRGKNYDLVVVSSMCDYSYWSRIKSRCGALIVDLADSYLSATPGWRDSVKGPAMFFSGRWKYFEPSFRQALQRLCQNADVVLCSTPEQRASLLPYNERVVPVLDFHRGEIHTNKQDHFPHKPFRLVWEGVGESLFGFQQVAQALQKVASERPVELHLLTDLTFRRMNHVWPIRAEALVRKLLPGIDSYLYSWNRSMFSTIVSNCDLALIPVDLNNPMARSKPENRLLMFWRLGLPCITSSTPAYDRVFSQCGLKDSSCTESEWYGCLTEHMTNPGRRQQNVKRGADYLAREVDEAGLLTKWDTAVSLALQRTR